jgi:hypothetical protein
MVAWRSALDGGKVVATMVYGLVWDSYDVKGAGKISIARSMIMIEEVVSWSYFYVYIINSPLRMNCKEEETSVNNVPSK